MIKTIIRKCFYKNVITLLQKKKIKRHIKDEIKFFSDDSYKKLISF